MTPKEKAYRIVNKFIDVSRHEDYEAVAVGKQCAIIAVDEILAVLGGVWVDVVSTTARSCSDTLNHQNFWEQVKEEINIL